MLRLFTLLAFLPNAGWSEAETGNAVYAACNATGENSEVKFGYCIGYVGGAWEGIKYGAGVTVFQIMELDEASTVDLASNKLLGACVPETVERGQMLDVFTRYLEQHPESRHESARGLLLLAMQGAFPCG